MQHGPENNPIRWRCPTHPALGETITQPPASHDIQTLVRHLRTQLHEILPSQPVLFSSEEKRERHRQNVLACLDEWLDQKIRAGHLAFRVVEIYGEEITLVPADLPTAFKKKDTPPKEQRKRKKTKRAQNEINFEEEFKENMPTVIPAVVRDALRLICRYDPRTQELSTIRNASSPSQETVF